MFPGMGQSLPIVLAGHLYDVPSPEVGLDEVPGAFRP